MKLETEIVDIEKKIGVKFMSNTPNIGGRGIEPNTGLNPFLKLR